MKIIGVAESQANAYESIKDSMNQNEKISICNNLDACGCTGNGQC